MEGGVVVGVVVVVTEVWLFVVVVPLLSSEAFLSLLPLLPVFLPLLLLP